MLRDEFVEYNISALAIFALRTNHTDLSDSLFLNIEQCGERPPRGTTGIQIEAGSAVLVRATVHSLDSAQSQ